MDSFRSLILPGFFRIGVNSSKSLKEVLWILWVRLMLWLRINFPLKGLMELFLPFLFAAVTLVATPASDPDRLILDLHLLRILGIGSTY